MLLSAHLTGETRLVRRRTAGGWQSRGPRPGPLAPESLPLRSAYPGVKFLKHSIIQSNLS